MQYKKQKSGVSCIVPFYNEGVRVLRVVETLLKVTSLNEIICVDDGSTDDTFKRLLKFTSKVKVIRSSDNLGKAKAVSYGLVKSKNDNILLIDADLTDINTDHIEKSIKTFRENASLNMIILRLIDNKWIFKFIRSDTVIAGQRLIRKNDLQNVLKVNPRKYQLELAMNDYMVKNNKKYCWMPFSCKDVFKKHKYGLFRGVKKELQMYVDLITYKGVFYYIKSMASFCKERCTE